MDRRLKFSYVLFFYILNIVGILNGVLLLNTNSSSTSMDEEEVDPIPHKILEQPEEINYIIRNRPVTLQCKVLQAVQINFRCMGKWVNPAQHIRFEGTHPLTGLPYIQASIDVLKEQLDEYKDAGQGFWCECYIWSSPDDHKQPIISRRSFVRMAYLRKHFEPHGPVSASVSLGLTAVLQCFPPDGDPIPDILWQKDGEMFDLKRRQTNNYIISNDGSLIVTMARLMDIGNYSCVAENVAAKRVSEPAYLNVYINGGWSSWGRWSECNRFDCGRGSQHRMRSCSNPPPMNGGSQCQGESRQRNPCVNICPEDGKWSDWSSWSACGIECRQHRRRLCDNPPPSNGGIHCEGSDLDTANCTIELCNGIWYQETMTGQRSKTLLLIGLPFLTIIVTGLVVLFFCLLKRRSLSYFRARDEPDLTKPVKKNSVQMYDQVIPCYTSINDVFEFRAPVCCTGKQGRSIQFARMTSIGGKIFLPHSGISMIIPKGAIPEGESVDVFLGVLREDQDRPKLLVGQTLLSPVIVCGPWDLILHKPIKLIFQHCANVSEGHWVMSVYSCHHSKDDQMTSQWKLLTTVGEDDFINSRAHLDSEQCFLSTDRLMRFALIGQKNMFGWAVKYLRLAVFSAFALTSPEHVLRIYVVDDTQDAIEGVLEVESGFGGYLLVDTKQISCHSSGDELCLELENIGEGWMYRSSSSSYQEIPLSHIWSGTQNYLHCSFTLDHINMSQDLLVFKIHVRQKSITAIEHVIHISYRLKL